jgi:hypothetical protein
LAYAIALSFRFSLDILAHPLYSAAMAALFCIALYTTWKLCACSLADVNAHNK